MIRGIGREGKGKPVQRVRGEHITVKGSRREFVKAAGAGLVGVGLATAMWSVRAAALARKRYNVLFIGIDDLRVQLSTYGFEQMKTPNFERLARMGVQFERAYVQQAVCAASRASFLTGCRPDTTGVNYPYTPWFKEEFLAAHPDIGTYFKSYGYYTRYLGKVHHGFHPPQTEEHCRPAPGGIKGRLYALPENIHEGPKPTWKGKVKPWEAADVADTEYEDGLIAEETIRTIQRAQKSGKPFFIAPGFFKPHLPLCAPRKYWDMYEPEDIQLAAVRRLGMNVPPFALAHHALRGWGGIDDPENVPEDTARTLIHGYYACTSFIDAQIGKLLHALERMNLMDSTVIMLWSDHGYHLGDHGMWGKSTNFEWSTRSPLYLYVPGIDTGGRKTDALVEYVDMYPTLTDLCGLETPEYMEGTSFAALLEDPDRPWKKAAFSQFPRDGIEREGYSIRTDRFRYTEWKERATGRVIARELYDHSTDPLEANNVVDVQAYQEVAEKLAGMLKAGWKEALPAGYTNSSNNPPGDESWYKVKRSYVGL
jgi:iduronate 2-sulfatase